jgi:acyl-CoA thioesterase-2
MDTPETLLQTLTLERIEVNLFRGHSHQKEGRLFGGQVIAQSLLAAYATVEERMCHSLHCYFIRPGDSTVPILLDVDRSRDGGTFTTRRVTAIQHGQQIFNLAASFQTVEEGYDHQTPMPDVVAAEDLPDDFEAQRAKIEELAPEEARRVMAVRRPIEMRSLHRAPSAAPPRRDLSKTWMRASAAIGDDPRMHQAILAYASDMNLLSTAMRPHGVNWNTPGLQSASLDHAMWFHRPSNFNQWHLYSQDTPSSSGGRGLVRGEVYSADGHLVASVVQEGLMRMRPGK